MVDLEKIRPLGDRVVLKVIDISERRSGSIIIPKTAKDQELAWHCEVLAVGPGKVHDNGKLVECQVKRGDKVVIGKYIGTRIRVDGEELFVAHEEEILGIVEEI